MINQGHEGYFLSVHIRACWNNFAVWKYIPIWNCSRCECTTNKCIIFFANLTQNF